MKILFVHQNFPAQFKHLAPALAKIGHEVIAFAAQKQGVKNQFEGVKVFHYQPSRSNSPSIHPWIADLETKVIRGDATYLLALDLKGKGFTPDVIVAHPGWGEALFLKSVWPLAKLLIYCEYFYQEKDSDVGFDPEYSPSLPRDASRIALKNLNNILSIQVADAGISPTHWQASTFPEAFKEKIAVIHDGIDTQNLHSAENTQLTLRNQKYQLSLSKEDQVITFVNRNLEPYRGFHIFMRALPEILKKNPKVRILIVGGDGVSYGTPPKGKKTWRNTLLDELGDQLDLERIHFLGILPYQDYLSVLRISSIHVYLTYPFVLSWSLLEAMSIGCTIVASNTPPVAEVVQDGINGKLVDFFDTKALVSLVTELLNEPLQRERLGNAARQYAIDHFDLQTNCLPRQIALINALEEQK